MKYSDKLKDPRWQKKRLMILNRDNWMCQCCNETEKMLTVHHINYNNEPWEAEEKDLITLCENCHFWEHSKEFFEQGLDYYSQYNSVTRSEIFSLLRILNFNGYINRDMLHEHNVSELIKLLDNSDLAKYKKTNEA